MDSPIGSIVSGSIGAVIRPGPHFLPSIPREGLLSYIKEVDGVMIDTIGESSITIVAGSADDFPNCTFSFPATADMLSIDTLLGGDVLFDSGNAMAPFERTWGEWFNLPGMNVDYLWIGVKGVAGYNVDQGANSSKILRCLKTPSGNIWIDTQTWDDSKVWTD